MYLGMGPWVATVRVVCVAYRNLPHYFAWTVPFFHPPTSTSFCYVRVLVPPRPWQLRNSQFVCSLCSGRVLVSWKVEAVYTHSALWYGAGVHYCSLLDTSFCHWYFEITCIPCHERYIPSNFITSASDSCYLLIICSWIMLVIEM